MAVQTPLHQQRRSLKNQRHLVNGAVARATTNAFVDVNAVIEINEVGKTMDLYPLDRPIGAIALADRF